MGENKKNYCVAVIFKNGMKITSKPTTKRKAKQYYIEKCCEFKANFSLHMEFEDTIFKTEDIFMILLHSNEEEKNQ